MNPDPDVSAGNSPPRHCRRSVLSRLRGSGRITGHPEIAPKSGYFPIGDQPLGTQNTDCGRANECVGRQLTP
jgi:hypothetical protein